MLKVGLTGGLASGKTFVGGILASLGCHCIQADELGHQVLLPTGEAYQPVVDRFGTTILAPNGEIDRRTLGLLVFPDAAKLQDLTALVHPAVGRLQKDLLARIEHDDPDGIAVVEAAILVETGSYRNFDKLIVAVCSLEQQVERAMRRDSLTREEVLSRLGRQLPLEEKIRVADYVIDTGGTKEETRRQTMDVYRELTKK